MKPPVAAPVLKPPAAAADSTPADRAAADALVIGDLERDVQAIRELLAGRPGARSIGQLFRIEVLDVDAVVRRRSELEQEIAALEAELAAFQRAPSIAPARVEPAPVVERPAPDGAPAGDTKADGSAPADEAAKDGATKSGGDAPARAGAADEGGKKDAAKADGDGTKREKKGADGATPAKSGAQETAKPRAEEGAKADAPARAEGPARVEEPGASASPGSASSEILAEETGLKGRETPVAAQPSEVTPEERARREAERARARRVLELRLELARARLEFLNRPLDERKALVEVDRARQQVEHQKLLAQVEKAEANKDAEVAENERLAALEKARKANSEMSRALAQARADIEAALRDLAVRREQLAGEEVTFLEDRSDRLEQGEVELVTHAEGLLEDPDDPEIGREAARLYDALVVASRDARDDLAAALAVAEGTAALDRYDPALPVIPDDADLELLRERDGLVARVAELHKAEDEYLARARHLAQDKLDAAFEREQLLNRTMIGLIDHLAPDKRELILGFGPEGLAQLRREVTHMGLAIRWYRFYQRGLPERLLASLRDTYTLLRVLGTILWLLVIVIAGLVIVRRRGRIFDALKTVIIRGVRRPWLVRPLQNVVAALHALLPSLCLLFGVMIGWKVLDRVHDRPEMRALHVVVLDYAIYRVALTASHRGIGWATRARALGKRFHDKVLNSLRMIGRTVLAIAVFLSVSGDLFGHGYVYRLVLGFAWVGSLPIAAILIRRFRDDIAQAYLAQRPQGLLADAVGATRGRWYGFFVATAAVVYLLVMGAVRLVQRFVLGFEHSRKALAFVFRRRLERRGEAVEQSGERGLPDDLASALRLAPVEDPRLSIQHFPALEAFCELVRGWERAPSIGATLVVGDTGIGKTSWLAAATRAIDSSPIVRISLKRRLLTEVQVLQAIARGLDAPDDAARGLVKLAAFIKSRPRGLIMVDDAQLLYLRGVGTFQAWSTLLELIERTGEHAYWTLTMAQQPYEYLRWARGGMDVFRQLILLEPWSEAEIAELTHQRVAQAGYTVRYDDLIVDQVEGVEAQAQLVSTEREYARLIWDYADGVPLVALHCWRGSLDHEEGKRVRVRLFRRPPVERLEQLGEAQRFLLASVAWHQTLTVAEAMRSLRYPRLACQDALLRLAEWGVLEQAEDERYRITTAWLRPVFRFLRRHHLIAS
ncbi:MAG: hypothetical protein R3A51_19720 [Nannocystaceae bacterium]